MHLCRDNDAIQIKIPEKDILLMIYYGYLAAELKTQMYPPCWHVDEASLEDFLRRFSPSASLPEKPILEMRSLENSTEEDDASNITIQRPHDPKPQVQLGWQFIRADWLCYWMWQHGPINNRFDRLLGNCKQLELLLQLVREWRRKESDLFTKFLSLEPPETWDIVEKYIKQLGFEEKSEKSIMLIENLARFPIMIDRRGEVGDGRHRIFKAAECGLPELLVYVAS